VLFFALISGIHQRAYLTAVRRSMASACAIESAVPPFAAAWARLANEREAALRKKPSLYPLATRRNDEPLRGRLRCAADRITVLEPRILPIHWNEISRASSPQGEARRVREIALEVKMVTELKM
jgi:hypothetical protein